MTDPFDGFDIENPELPKAIKKGAMASGGYPYADQMPMEAYEAELYRLHTQLVRLQAHLGGSGERMVLVFEGRDAAGKGGTIKTYLEFLNPRSNLIAALPKPDERERTQWYFQRYVDYLPAAGETVLFDRSWYNRAGVEPVMGFCSQEQSQQFIEEAPRFERMLTSDGVHLFKFWLDIGREMQLKRFHDRRYDPLKTWKLSPIDLAALPKWAAYSAARDVMLDKTDTDYAPWSIVLANDKRRARLNLIRKVLTTMSYDGKLESEIGTMDESIVLTAKAFLKRDSRD